MSEVIEQQRIQELALSSIHQKLGATFVEQSGWMLPANYGDSQQEYRHVRESGNGLLDLSYRGRIKVTGSEALLFLNGLITNDMKTLAENDSMPAVFPTVQGRIIAAVRITRFGESYLLETETDTHQKVLNTIQRFTLAGDFKVADITLATVQLSLQGKSAISLASAVLSLPSALTNALETSWRGSKVLSIRSRHTNEDGIDLIADRVVASELWAELIDAGAKPFGYEALEVLRIEAGVPRFGVDMDESNIVTETNLDDAVSFTKGCYIGQEIIIRIKHRGHVAKKLTGISADSMLATGSVVNSGDGKEIGKITSATFSPTLNKSIALGYVRYEYLVPGTEVAVVSNGNTISATVTDLPFIDTKND